MSKTIPLTQDKHAIVDNEDYDFLMRWKWHYQAVTGCNLGYAARMGGKQMILMHRIIMNAPKGQLVDHKNGNGLDCRKCNMRLATQAQNLRNRGRQRNSLTSKYKGVRWEERKQRWVACVWLDGKRFYAGYHRTEEAAAVARDAKARELHGEFARLTFPRDGEAAA